MAKKVRILVVCGTGIATSTAAENKLMVWLNKRGYNAATSQCIAAEVNMKAGSINPHVIVTTTKLKIVKVEKDGLAEDGSLDAQTLRPFFFDSGSRQYLKLGGSIGKAFDVGRNIGKQDSGYRSARVGVSN